LHDALPISTLVDHVHRQNHREFALDLVLPLDVDPFVGVIAVLAHVRTVALVHHHAAAGAGEADDGVARDRVAAAGEGDHGPLGAAYDQPLALAHGLRLRRLATDAG